MPRARVRSAFSVEARTIMPTRVRVSTNHTTAHTSSENAKTNSWYCGSRTGPSSMTPSSADGAS